MSVKIKGLNKLQKKLEKISDSAKKLEEKHQVPISELLTRSFLAKHSKFKDPQELFDKSGFTINSEEDFKAIPDADWDKYISSVSDFSSWKEMLQAATAEYVKRRMGLRSL
jgi:hypothetical protein